MKVLRSQYPHAKPFIPWNGGYRVNFVNGVAVLPDGAADMLVSIGGGHYTLEREFVGPVEKGSTVLIHRDTGLGDVLLCTPLIRKLSKECGATVDVLTNTENVPLFDGNPYVRKCHSIQTSNLDHAQYDLHRDLCMTVENAEMGGRYLHRADAFAWEMDTEITEEERRIDYFIKTEEISWANDAVAARRSKHKAIVAYVWKASITQRSWSAERHKAVIAALELAGFGVVILDHHKQEIDGANILNLTNQLSVREAIAIIGACDVALTPDTGLFHAAGALDKPTVAYFGPMAIGERHTHKHLVTVDTRENCALFPCRKYQCLNRADSGEVRCLTVSPASVVQAVKHAAKMSKPLRMAASNSKANKNTRQL